MASDESSDRNQLLFAQLVLSFQATAYQQMGKAPNPFSGKIERNLEMARHSIDMLGMLQERTKGNLSPQEEQYLANVLTELRLTYLEELKKPQPEQKSDESSPKDETPRTDSDS